MPKSIKTMTKTETANSLEDFDDTIEIYANANYRVTIGESRPAFLGDVVYPLYEISNIETNVVEASAFLLYMAIEAADNLNDKLVALYDSKMETPTDGRAH